MSQEAFFRFHRESAKGTVIESPKADLSAVTTRFRKATSPAR